MGKITLSRGLLAMTQRDYGYNGYKGGQNDGLIAKGDMHYISRKPLVSQKRYKFYKRKRQQNRLQDLGSEAQRMIRVPEGYERIQ